MKVKKEIPTLFVKCMAGEVLGFVQGLKRRGFGELLGEYASLGSLDFVKETCYLLLLDNRPVGFASVRYGARDSKHLSKIFVLPQAREHGVATWFIRGTKISDISIPVRHIRFISLCRTLGFTYNETQSSPLQLAELSRHIPETSLYATRPRNRVSTYRMG